MFYIKIYVYSKKTNFISLVRLHFCSDFTCNIYERLDIRVREYLTFNIFLHDKSEQKVIG